MKQSEQIGQLIMALALAKVEFGPILRDKRAGKEGEKFSYMYSPIENVLAAVTPALSANQLALIGDVELSPDGSLALMTRLVHESDQFIETTIPLGRITGGIKEIGSAITYGRRYGITTLLQVAADDDDDGTAAAAGGVDGRKGTKSATPEARPQGSTAPVTRVTTSTEPTPAGKPTADEFTQLVELMKAVYQDTAEVDRKIREVLKIPDGQDLWPKRARLVMTRDHYKTLNDEASADRLGQAPPDDDVQDFSGPEPATLTQEKRSDPHEGGEASELEDSAQSQPDSLNGDASNLEATRQVYEDAVHEAVTERRLPKASRLQTPRTEQWDTLASRAAAVGLSTRTVAAMRLGNYEDALTRVEALEREQPEGTRHA